MEFKSMAASLAAFAAAIGAAINVCATTYYVKPDGNDSAAGTSWETALATPAAGIEKIKAGSRNHELVISNGVYTLSDALAPVIDELRRRGLLSVAVLSSIEFGHIVEARRLDKDIFVHHIFSKPELIGELAAIGNAGLSYDYPDLDEVPAGLVERVHARGVKLCLRAGDTPEAVARMLAIGLDYIPTNRANPL
jgi:hypothetical protein